MGGIDRGVGAWALHARSCGKRRDLMYLSVFADVERNTWSAFGRGSIARDIASYPIPLPGTYELIPSVDIISIHNSQSSPLPLYMSHIPKRSGGHILSQSHISIQWLYFSFCTLVRKRSGGIFCLDQCCQSQSKIRRLVKDS
jgi:hypothetical protein